MLTKEQLKEKLLKLGCFDDNEYFDKYLELCLDNVNTKRTKYITNAHHIIPRKYYKFNKLEIDNSPENIVNLRYYDHILAHYYLVLCSIPGYLQYAKEQALCSQERMGWTYLLKAVLSVSSVRPRINGHA